MPQNTQSQPGYYATVPANVRYCKDLEPMAKLLYGEITALCNKEGYCWATNRYFAELYDVDISTVKRWIASLKRNNFIFIESPTGFNDSRKIFISSAFQKIFTEAHFCTPPGSFSNPPQLKNEPHNITSNTKSKNPPLSSPPKREPKPKDSNPKESKPKEPERPKPEPKESEEPKISLRSESLRSEEEDFSNLSLLENTTLSPKEKLRIVKDYSAEQITKALRVAQTQPVKKSFMALFLNILQNPDRWAEKVEHKPLTIAQQKCLEYNHELAKFSPNLAKENEKLIPDGLVKLVMNRNGKPAIEQCVIDSYDFDKDFDFAKLLLNNALKRKENET